MTAPSDLPRALVMWQKAQDGDICATRRIERAKAADVRVGSSMKYRYLGDLANTPPCDALFAEEHGNLVLRASNGAPITSVPGEKVVSVHYFPQSVNYTGWSGIAIGGAVAFSEGAKAHSAALTVAYSAGDRLLEFSLGNRPGMFSPKYTFASFMASAMGIGWVASSGSHRREAEIGPLAYARELGMTTLADEVEGRQSPAAVQASSPAQPALSAALETLKAVRDQGLITADEYATKRAEVLARF